MEDAPSADRTLYCGRWWVMLLSAWGTFAQGAMWNFYSPVSDTVISEFGWSNDLLQWFLNASNITFVTTCAFWPWIIDVKGLRFSVLLAATSLVTSAMLRTIPVPNAWHSVMVVLSMVFNGFAAPCFNLIPPVVSAAWFPVQALCSHRKRKLRPSSFLLLDAIEQFRTATSVPHNF